MTAQEKLQKIEDVLAEYLGNEGLLVCPAQESARQKAIREDLHTVVSLLGKEQTEVRADMSAAEIKAKLQGTWEKTKPDAWKE